MKLIRGLHNLREALDGSVVTLGNFDGVHLGHQQLLESIKTIANELNLPTVVITFEPQPKDFFANKQVVPRLMRLSEKYLALQQQKIDYLCVLYFDQMLSELSAEDFIKQILVEKLGMKAVIVGHDFKFGYKRQGDVTLLAEMGHQLGFEARALDPVKAGDEVVSSTLVRKALQAGEMKRAEQLLGQPYTLRGKVTYGHQRGRELGFPTANINLHRELVPISGVFVVKVLLEGKQYNGVANVGIRPTFYGQRVLLEVHLFDFNRSIYGANLEVSFVHKLREEKRFDDFDQLVQQIHQDVKDAKLFFATHVIEA